MTPLLDPLLLPSTADPAPRRSGYIWEGSVPGGSCFRTVAKRCLLLPESSTTSRPGWIRPILFLSTLYRPGLADRSAAKIPSSFTATSRTSPALAISFACGRRATPVGPLRSSLSGKATEQLEQPG